MNSSASLHAISAFTVSLNDVSLRSFLPSMSLMNNSVGLVTLVATKASRRPLSSVLNPRTTRRPPTISRICPLFGVTTKSAVFAPTSALIKISPFGRKSAIAGSYCQPLVRFCGAPPLASMSISRAFLVRSAREMKRSFLLSGDQPSPCSSPCSEATRRGSPPATGMTKMSRSLRGASSRSASYGSLASESASCCTTESGRSCASAVKAIHLPSGDTVASRCEYRPDVSCTRVAPSNFCVNTCCGRMTRASRAFGMYPTPFTLYGKFTICRPSNRACSTGFVMAPYGGRAIAPGAPAAAAPKPPGPPPPPGPPGTRTAPVVSTTSVKTAKLLSFGTEPVG